VPGPAVVEGGADGGIGMREAHGGHSAPGGRYRAPSKPDADADNHGRRSAHHMSAELVTALPRRVKAAPGLSARRDAEFTEYVHARLSWLRGLAYVLCQDWQRADDLVQAAVTRLYVRWDQASSADHLDGYVRAILVREYLAQRRSAWSRRVVLAGEVPDRADRAQDHDAGLDLQGALATLPPGQRATLVLRFYCDLSVDQAARALGCSPGTVKSQTAKGLGALRRWLEPGGADGPDAARARPRSVRGSEHG